MTSSLLPLVFSSGWASGVNAYLVVLVLGLSDRFGDLEQVPDVLGRTDVLIGAGVLYAIEFVADKVPYLDSTWDAISTVIRPTVAAVLGGLFAADMSGGAQAGFAAVGGVTALASHSVKAGGRMAINTSPEPFSNIGASLGEDVTVLGVMALALQHPWIALSVAGTFLVLGLLLLWFVLKYVRRGWGRWRGRDARGGTVA